MKYLNSYNGSVTEGFFDFFKKPPEETLKKRELLKIITDCCKKGLTFYNLRYEPMNTDVIRTTNGPAFIINDDLTVSFNGNISLYGWKEETFPFKFKKVRGNFHMERSYINSLDFIPQIVTKNLDISNNGLDSLESLNVNFVGGSFNCNSNNLVTLNHLPKEIVGDVHAQANDICNFDGIDFRYIKNIDLYLNPISYIPDLWNFLKKDADKYELFKEYDAIRPPDKIGEKPYIIKDRINDFLQNYKKVIVFTDSVYKKYEVI